MADMYDSVTPANIPAFLAGAPCLRITVLGDPDGEAFDAERGDAGNDAVAAAVNTRHARGEWSVGYTNRDNFDALTTALAARGLEWSSGLEWPKAGVYLWAAAPGLTALEVTDQWGVIPLAVQNRWTANFDVSWTQADFPGRVAGYIDGALYAWPAAAFDKYRRIEAAPPPTPPVPPVPPPKPPGGVVTVQLPILAEGAREAPVGAVQRLLDNLVVDSVFGPATHAAVVAFQTSHGLTADGIVGQHTWGALLGAPQ